MRHLWALAIALALVFSPHAHAVEVVKRAIIVGANDGGSLLESLRFAEVDARRVSGVLGDLGGFEPEHIDLLLTPTVAQLRHALKQAAELHSGDAEVLFLFYYSGHADELGLQLRGERLPFDELKQSIRRVPAEVHLGIVDACRSGAIANVKGAAIAQPFLEEGSLDAEGEAWIAASSPNEDAQESDQIQGSFFTYYLLSGLRGAADTGDGLVSLLEAYNYAYGRTVARTTGTVGGTQHPYYEFRIQGNGDLKLTSVREATARLTLPEDLTAEVAVLRLPEGTPVAEVVTTGERQVVLALEPGRYLLRRRAEHGVQEVTITLSEDSEVVVDSWGDAVAEVATRKGETSDFIDADEDGFLTLKLPVRWRDDGDGEPGKGEIDFSWVKDSPGIAGAASALLPGLGQIYDKRYGAGAMFMASTLTMHSVGWSASRGSDRRSATGPNPITLLAFALHGWAIADAAYKVERKEHFEVRRGATLSLETDFQGIGPYASGLAIDILPSRYFSFGLDRTGLVRNDDGAYFMSGSRLTLGPSAPRWRGAFFATLGLRVPTSPSEEGPSGPVMTYGGGAFSRHYLTPRYFVQAQLRLERAPELETLWGLGMGIHVGR